MTSEQMMTEIMEANLTYLMLAQNLILQDKPRALANLGISERSADLIALLTPAQLTKLASSNMLLCRLRSEDDTVWSLLTRQEPPPRSVDETAGRLRTILLMSSRFTEAAP